MAPIKLALVTGANKGIGKEVAKGLAQKGFHVLVGARNKEYGEAAVADLQGFGKFSFQQLDVTDPKSVFAAAEAVKSQFGHLDVLVNNAGIARVPDQDTIVTLSELPVESAAKQFAGIYQTNVFAVVTVTNAFLPLLRKAQAGRIVNVSSILGSMRKGVESGMQFSIYTAYSSSKVALNFLTAQYAADLKDTPIKVNSVCPGYCGTDLNDFQGPRSPSQGAVIAVEMAMVPADGPTGGFVDENGSIPW